jgi:hypothetical protein
MDSNHQDKDLLDSSSVDDGNLPDASVLSPLTVCDPADNTSVVYRSIGQTADPTIKRHALSVNHISPSAPEVKSSRSSQHSLQQVSRDHGAPVLPKDSTMMTKFRSPEWQSTKRARFADLNQFAVDNRTRTPGRRNRDFTARATTTVTQSRHALPDIDIYPGHGGGSGGNYDHVEDVDDVDVDEESQQSNPLQYIPSHHFAPTQATYTTSHRVERDSMSQSRQQPFLHSSNSHNLRQPSFQHTLGSPSNNSHPSVSTVTGSHFSSGSTRSRRSTISCRSSISYALMHNEVINLEGDAVVAKAIAASKRRQMYQQQAQLGQKRLASHRGVPLGGDLMQPAYDQQYDNMTDDFLLEGMEIGMTTLSGPETNPHFCTHSREQQRHHGGPVLSWGIAAEYIHAVRLKVRKYGHKATIGVSSLRNKTLDVTQRVLQHYRPPMSPRSRELKNLQFLQQSHKEKIGQWKFHSSRLSDGSDMEDMFLSDENFCDFVLVLTPQEVYRYWANLLDFREEHLGMMDSLDMWGRKMMAPDEAASTDTTESKSAQENDTMSDEQQYHDEEDRDIHTDLPAEFATPLTGLLRRRTKSSPGANHLYSNDTANTGSFRSYIHTQQSRTFSSTPINSAKQGTRMSMFDRAIHSPMLSNSSRARVVSQDYSTNTYAISESSGDGDTTTPRNGTSVVRRRWGNHTMPLNTSNMLSPPVRSLTRGAGSVSKLMIGAVTVKPKAAGNTNSGSAANEAEKENQEKVNPNCIENEEELPNPVIPRGILVRTNGMLQFLSALKRGIVVRRHRPNKEAIFCKIFSTDGGDTIQYHFVDPEDAMVAFKEQRVRYNRNLTHGSSPSKIRAVSSEWSCFDGPSDGSPVHKFKVPDHVAAQRYREKLHREHGFTKRLFEIATKAANSGMICASDLVSIQPAYHLDKRHPGVRKGEFGTASLRRSFSRYFTPLTFSLITTTRQGRKKIKNGQYKYSKEAEEKWNKGEGSELHYRILDFEVATEGEFWLVLRGFLHLHRDAAANRYAAKRSAGIGGGLRSTTASRTEDECGDGAENRLQCDAFLEPKTAGLVEKAIVKARKLDLTYLTGAIAAGAVPPPSDYFLGFKSPGTQIWSRLRLAGLETHRIYAVDTRRVMIKIRCPEDRLTDVAEVLRLKMQTIEGSFAPFREDTAHVFKARDDPFDIPSMYNGRMASLLRSKDRQNVIDFIIGSRIRDSGAELGQRSDLGKMIQARVPLHMPRKLDSLCNDWVYYWRRERWTAPKQENDEKIAETSSDTSRLSIEEGFSVKEKANGDKEAKDDRPVPNFFVRFFVEAFNQPLDAVEDYFGEKVTFYFAWLQHCAHHLFVLSFFGLIMALCQVSTDNFDHPLRPYYAMVVMLWTFIVLINWRKRSNFLAYRWGSMDQQVQETTRPEFHGEYVIDPITNEWDIKYPSWKRWLKYLISIPITVFFTSLAMVLILLVHANRDKQMANYVEQKTNPNADPVTFQLKLENIGHNEMVGDVELSKDLLLDPTYWFIMAFLPAMLGLCIPILNLVLMNISTLLNDFENYRFESEYRTHLIIKVFSFRFVSQFGTVYYYAFISTGTRQAIENGIIRMGTSVMVYTTVAHWWNIFLQVYFLMFIRYIRRRLYQRRLRKELKHVELLEEDHLKSRRSDAEAREIRLMNKRMLLDQAQDELWFEVMNPPHDSFPEYVQAVVQFSFVVCFSVVLPITPLLVLFNYLLSMRFDAYKLCRGRRRPLAMRTGGIGVWEHLLHIVAVIAVLTNCWLIALTNEDFVWFSNQVGPTATVFVVVAWEHSMLLIKYTMSNIISPFPKEIRDEMKRKQHDQEQERYAAMRMKKERSRRSKYRKSLSEDFNKAHEESKSLLDASNSSLEGSGIGSEITCQRQDAARSSLLGEGEALERRLPRANKPGGTFAGQPGELYEC